MKNHYLNSIQKVIDAIEKNLDHITIEELIKISGYSYYHFHRIFKAYTGESLKKYMKRLQMEKTLQQMQANQDNITQIAIQAGYHIPSSFNKAFKEMFGVNPTEYKKEFASKRIIYPRISPQRIEQVDDIHTYYARHIGRYDDLDAPIQKIISFAMKNRLIDKDFSLLAIPHDNPDITDESKLRFDICIKSTKTIDLTEIDWLNQKVICGGEFAVFLHRGDPSKTINTYNSIFGSWLYESNVLLRNEPIFQKFLNNKYEVQEEALLTEIYVPISEVTSH